MFQSTFNPNQINSLKSRSMLNQINFCIFFWLSEVEKKLQKKKKLCESYKRKNKIALNI
jgi:hypothetical protein